MGWVWREEEEEEEANEARSSPPSLRGGAVSEYSSSSNKSNYSSSSSSSSSSGEACSTRKIVRSQCKTEEVEPGKFIRKCEKREEVLRDSLGKPAEVLTSNKEYTEEDVTDQVVKGSLSLGKSDAGSPFNFPGLRSDIEDMERQFMGGISCFFEAAEKMKKGIFDAFGDVYGENPISSPSIRRGIPIQDHTRVDTPPKPKEPNSGDFDLSGLARDV